ncbi:MAG: hydrogenase maturation nickel metallochaperone HypA [Gammaproteobacteria bacterium]|nr:hydrogenase maturation nickel metallochaperone HypA [Gammaproteobacteria bacterium]
MHELSVCQSIVDQVVAIANNNHAQAICKIDLAIGPLAGIDIQLLEHAFPVASAGTLAEHAALATQQLPIKISCQSCKRESEARANHLVCSHCGDWHTTIISGDEMLITSVELDVKEDAHYV